jgi:hypothetical protein
MLLILQVLNPGNASLMIDLQIRIWNLRVVLACQDCAAATTFRQTPSLKVQLFSQITITVYRPSCTEHLMLNASQFYASCEVANTINLRILNACLISTFHQTSSLGLAEYQAMALSSIMHEIIDAK